MSRATFERLLNVARQTHGQFSALSDFCPFPEDLTPIPVEHKHVPPADLFLQELRWGDGPLTSFRQAFLDAGPVACWRETYKETDIGSDFMDRFGCYCLIGEGGGWISSGMSAYMVYMPPNLHYPWHQHPAEELYFVIGGEGEFHREGESSQFLGEGQASFHASNQPHALTTHDNPVMAYVLWRNHLDEKPVWTERKVGT